MNLWCLIGVDKLQDDWYMDKMTKIAVKDMKGKFTSTGIPIITVLKIP